MLPNLSIFASKWQEAPHQPSHARSELSYHLSAPHNPAETSARFYQMGFASQKQHWQEKKRLILENKFISDNRRMKGRKYTSWHAKIIKNLPAEMGLALMQVNESWAFSSAEKNNRNPAGAVWQVWMQSSLVSANILKYFHNSGLALGDTTQEQHSKALQQQQWGSCI